MENKIKPNIRPVMGRQQKSQKRFFLVMSLLFLAALLISMLSPVYYVPLFKNIAIKYGLSVDIAKQLTLFDLALSSLGVETENMARAFQKYKVEYEPDIFLSSRASTEGSLIDFDKIYQGPEYADDIQSKKQNAAGGIVEAGRTATARAINRSNLKDNDRISDLNSGKYTEYIDVDDELTGSKRRQVRGSFDIQDEGPIDVEALAVSRAYPDDNRPSYSEEVARKTEEEFPTVKPVIIGETPNFAKPERRIAELVGDSSFTDTFSSLRNFGGHEGILGYYIKDDMPVPGFFHLFGTAGEDAFLAYFYSHAAARRKYIESAKHFSEVAFQGDEPKDEILIARGQKEENIPPVDIDEVSPLALILVLRHNMRECNAAHKVYENDMKRLRRDYNNYKTQLKNISRDENNVAISGAPGSCNEFTHFPPPSGPLVPLGRPAKELRDTWNGLVGNLKTKCEAILNAGRTYAAACKMTYEPNPAEDSCDAIDALEVSGGTDWFDLMGGEEFGICRGYIIWTHPNKSKTFHGCNSREECAQAQDDLFEAIANNVVIDSEPGFIFQ